MCWRPKSRIWVHHLGENFDDDEISMLLSTWVTEGEGNAIDGKGVKISNDDNDYNDSNDYNDAITSPQEEGGKGQHGGDVTHSYVADVDTPDDGS